MRERERVLTAEQKGLVLEWYAEGATVNVMAEKLEVPGRTPKQKRSIVYAMLCRRRLPIVGTKNRARRPIRLDHAKILSLYKTGLGAPAIAKRIGCGTTIIHSITTDAGITRKHKGRTTQHGYAKVRIDGCYVLEHRHIMEQQLGRRLAPNETVHHINGDGMDNRPENLQLRVGKHGKGSAYRCRDCGSYNVEAVAIAERGGHV